ncbi:MAG: hypothetical protein LQ342_003933 [Letrouitia transgressa]|nr:MAG: hypothetical protein LQ342_003933 [Letrouitia transgressa]
MSRSHRYLLASLLQSCPWRLLLLGGSLACGRYSSRTYLICDSSNGKEAGPLIGQQTSRANVRLRTETKEIAGIRTVKEIETTASNAGSDLFGIHLDNRAWASFSQKLHDAHHILKNIKWSELGDQIGDAVLPDWAADLPAYLAKLQSELSMSPGGLAEEIWSEAQDPDFNPEITRKAEVRIGNELCAGERQFQKRRKIYIAKALARYIGVKEDEMNPEDVPTIALCGSGGGLRALVAGASSFHSAQEVGLFDCVTYTAGVSGSCWLQALYYSSLGDQNYSTVLDHLKKRIGTHIAYPPTALGLLTTAPTNKFLLSGLVEKLKGNSGTAFGPVDVYGILLASRLFVPRGELAVDDRNLKISNQQLYVAGGAQPLPIYTAVRHEIPPEEKNGKKRSTKQSLPREAMEAKNEAWFQWFEFTPYELWSEEIEAGIPSWSVGRRFSKGVSVPQDNGINSPELRIPILLGIWGSAFCATLSHYYKEIQPVIKRLAGFGGIDDLLEEQDDELVKIHPIKPAAIPNYVQGLEDQVAPTAAKSIFSSDQLQLADAGMSNNLPIYPLLRPGRDVDVLIVFDSSADIKKSNWLSVVDGYAKQRGIKGWPLGAGWPKENLPEHPLTEDLDATKATRPPHGADTVPNAQEDLQNTTSDRADSDLGYCNVWVGTTLVRANATEPPQSKRMSPNTILKAMEPEAGIAVVYFPLLPNPKVAGVDPEKSDFMSTWNFIYGPEDIEKVVRLARTNFQEGEDQVKNIVRAAYERKKAQRLEQERRVGMGRWQLYFEENGDHFR